MKSFDNRLAKMEESKYVHIVEDVHLIGKEGESDKIIIDCGSPSSLASAAVVNKYLKENKLEKANLKSISCAKVFRFRETKYISNKILNIPIKVNSVNEYGDEDVFTNEISTYIINGTVPWLLGMDLMPKWKIKVDINDKTLEVYKMNKEYPIHLPVEEPGSI